MEETSQSARWFRARQRERLFLGIIFCLLILLPIAYKLGTIEPDPPIPQVFFESPVTSANFIVFKDGLTTYAKNGDTGIVSFSSTNTSKVLEYCIGDGDAYIHLKEGEYTLTKEIVPKSNTVIKGNGWGLTKLFISGSTDGFHISGTATNPVTNVTISNLYIDGTGQTGKVKGIYGHYIYNIKIDNVYVYNTTFTGIGIDFLRKFWIQDCHVDSCARLYDGNGIGIGGSVNGYDLGFITGNIVENIKRQGTAFGYGIWLEDLNVPTPQDLRYIIIDGNLVRNCTEGIGSTGSVMYTITNNVVAECTHGILLCNLSAIDNHPEEILISDNQFVGNKDGIRIEHPDARYILIANNIMGFNTQHGCIIKNADNITITGNDCGQNGNTGLYLYNARNCTVVGNRVHSNGVQDLFLSDDSDGNYITTNWSLKIRFDHTKNSCDYNYVFGNYVVTLSQSLGAPTGNLYVDNYPDNTI